MTLHAIILVGLGGMSGSIIRYMLSSMCGQFIGSPYQFMATMIINIIGSCAIGAAFTVFDTTTQAGATYRLFIITGVLSGFTTFSAFTMDSITLLQRGEYLLSIFNITASVVLSLLACITGIWLTRTLLS